MGWIGGCHQPGQTGKCTTCADRGCLGRQQGQRGLGDDTSGNTRNRPDAKSETGEGSGSEGLTGLGFDSLATQELCFESHEVKLGCNSPGQHRGAWQAVTANKTPGHLRDHGFDSHRRPRNEREVT
jgi:hypothetical protein